MALRVSNVTFFFSFSFFLFSLSLFTFTYSDAHKSPAAIYVFGDSLVDVGNNNYIRTYVRSNFPHNGIDFPGKKSTGRFSNGKNAADFIAEKAGFVSPPPYLSLNSSAFPMAGISFASGGAGIFNSTNEKLAIPLHDQIEHYSVVYEDLVKQMGSPGAEAHLSKSLFAVVIGSNDLFGYFDISEATNSYLSNKTNPTYHKRKHKTNPQQYVDSMVLTLEERLKRMHGFGTRKYVVAGIGPLGCSPSMRKENKSTGACNEEANYMAVKFNQGLESMLKGLQSELKDITYSYLDVYGAFASFLLTPAAYGFAEVKAACCGLGYLGTGIPCAPFTRYCSNRSDHLFWDGYHPTEMAARIIVDTTFDLNQLVT